MKNTLKASCLFLIMIISLIRCTKDNGNPENQFPELSLGTNKAINTENLTALKQSVSLLTNDEKYNLWQIKLSAILENDRAKLTSDQKNIIIEVKSLLDNYNFEALKQNPEIGDNFIKSNINRFEKHFDNVQLYMLIECPFFCKNFSLFKSKEYLSKIDPVTISSSIYEEDAPGDGGGGPSLSNCYCKYSIYCSSSPQPSGGRVCVDGSCNTVSGCGLFGSSSCTGKCK